jgi:F0F1-type ATP synthase membrane subunit c/vacuolar-type H+-ATPase subunit K
VAGYYVRTSVEVAIGYKQVAIGHGAVGDGSVSGIAERPDPSFFAVKV